ncbi:ABC transporter ATP-binding protein [Paenibacillus arenosi]|uniref:ABC transporter ATP-binding protein n=1 Tax=Paenibacillus arenosi TaxID=2774142 RepID=A0ABR9AZN4_9BACL|nr:ABC transporter ATP-binding protein [Paenibacillus arenosi]MBD8499361.1 ABC transporter ATP-binding protein [Paenibacillus arenosi]
MKELMSVYSYAKHFKKDMYKAIGFLTASIILGVIPYYIIYHIIMRFTEEQAMSVLYLCSMAGLILICLLLRTHTQYAGLSASHHLAYDTLMGMRKRVADKLRMMPMGSIKKHSTGSLKKNFVENIEDMEIILAHAMPEGISNLLTSLIIALTLFVLDWRMALLALAVFPIGILPVLLMIRDASTRMGPYYQSSKEMNENIIEYISGMEVIKVFNQTTSSFKKYMTSVDNYKTSTLDWFKVSWTHMTVYSIVLPSTLLFLLPFGTMFYMDGTLTLGTFVLCILLAMSMGLPLMRLVEFLPIFPNLQQKAQKIEQLFDEEEMVDGHSHAAPQHYSVSFQNVAFAYDDKEAIHDVSFTARENTVTALIGESGAGKSTLAKLLVRFWDIKRGEIRIGGINVKDMTFETLMNSISYVSQDIFLFNTSIMENIRMGRPDASDEEVMEMAKLAQCHNFILNTEHGYHTVVGDGGDKLSGGQRQRIAIARAMLKNAPIIVLDEATSATDPENEDKIQLALSGLIQGKTLIVIAHRLSTIVDANNIILLDKGQISAQGTHHELLALSPLYQKMWQAHAESMNWDIATKEGSN